MVQDIFLELIMLYPLSRKSDGLPTGAVSGLFDAFKLLEDVRSDDSKNKPTHLQLYLTQLGKTLGTKFTVTIKQIGQRRLMI